MKFTNKTGKLGLQKRLSRIEGQVRGISSMIEEERDCNEILQQLSAVRSALQSVTMQLAELAVQDCLIHNEENMESNQQTAHELVKMISRV